MSEEGNKALVRRFIDEIINGGNYEAIGELCVAGSMFAGGIEGQMRAMKSVFPDNQMTIDEIAAEGDKVAVRVTGSATNSGPMIGLPALGRLEDPVPPTGKSVTYGGMYFFTVVDNKIVRYAAELDQIGFLRQLGWEFTPPGQV